MFLCMAWSKHPLEKPNIDIVAIATTLLNVEYVWHAMNTFSMNTLSVHMHLWSALCPVYYIYIHVYI